MDRTGAPGYRDAKAGIIYLASDIVGFSEERIISAKRHLTLRYPDDSARRTFRVQWRTLSSPVE